MQLGSACAYPEIQDKYIVYNQSFEYFLENTSPNIVLWDVSYTYLVDLVRGLTSTDGGWEISTFLIASLQEGDY